MAIDKSNKISRKKEKEEEIELQNLTEAFQKSLLEEN